MPDLRHVPDLVPVELHHIHIVRVHTLASWRTGATRASMCRRETAYAQTLSRSSSVANDLSAYRPSGINVSNPFIQSVYCCKVRVSASGSACAENAAPGSQYSLHPSHPFPASQASKKFLATCNGCHRSASLYQWREHDQGRTPRESPDGLSVTSADCAGDSSRNPKPEASKPPRAGRLDGGN